MAGKHLEGVGGSETVSWRRPQGKFKKKGLIKLL